VITCFCSFYCTIRGPQFPGFSVSLKKRSLHFSDAQATNYFRHPLFRLLCKKQGDFDKECLLFAFCSIKKRACKGWLQPTGFKKTRFFRVREFQNCWENSWTPCSEDACLFVFFFAPRESTREDAQDEPKRYNSRSLEKTRFFFRSL